MSVLPDINLVFQCEKQQQTQFVKPAVCVFTIISLRWEREACSSSYDLEPLRRLNSVKS